MLIILVPTIFSVKAEVGSQQGQSTEIIPINVGYYNEGTGFGGVVPLKALLNRNIYPYEWEVENKKYTINVFSLLEEHLINKNNIPSKYHVIFINGGTNEEIRSGLFRLNKDKGESKIIKDNLENFINNGGGYIGHCGGGAWPVHRNGIYRTIAERVMDWNCFLRNPADPDVKEIIVADWHVGHPVISEYFHLNYLTWPFRQNFKLHPEYMACLFYEDGFWNQEYLIGGIPLHLAINNNEHPFMKDYLEDTIYMWWSGGPAFDVPNENPDICNLAKFTKEEDPYFNTATRVNAWGFRPWSEKALIKVLKELEFLLDWENYKNWDAMIDAWLDFFFKLLVLNGWKYFPDKEVDDAKLYPNSALLAIDNYNGEAGRLILCGPHPIGNVWDRDGRYITNHIDDKDNRLVDGLYLWKDDNDTPGDPNDDFPLYYDQHTYYSGLSWFFRREAAWTSDKVPEKHLPPVYGRSHVVDFETNIQPLEFTIECAVGENPSLKNNWDSTNLSLYYKYNPDSSSNWVYYDSVYKKPWNFTFNANEAEGAGEYHFCSILNTTLKIIPDGHPGYECDDFPPGPDAKCFVTIPSVSDFTITPADPYVNQNVSFYDESETKLAITSWSWDFGDGNTSFTQNTTHQYAESGTYAVELNITDNESNYHVASKNITVRNNQPVVGFISTQFVIIGSDNGEDIPHVTFESTSSDPDGSIVNWTWDFGDGSKGHGETINHTYSKQGFYPVTIKVTDNDNTTEDKFKLDCVLIANVLVNGSLSNDDPENHTWKTIQKAIDNLSTFDILYVLNGTYNGNIIINKSVVILGENRDGVIINGSVVMMNPHDYELVNGSADDKIVNMSGNELLFHFNNDSSADENYSSSYLVIDYSDQGNNGTFYGATWKNTSLKGDGAFEFDGMDDSINLSNIPALTEENVTVSSWVFWQSGSGTSDPIVSQSNNTHGYSLHVNSTNGKPAFRLDGVEAVSTVNISSDWHHIVGTHNGTSSLLKIYVDGKLYGTANKTGSGIDIDAFVGFDNNSNYFNGTLDEVAVWNRTLSHNEISDMYNANYGVFFDKITIKNAGTGIVPSNHSIIQNCNLVNNNIGISLNHNIGITIENCNVSGGSYGIKITDSNPKEYHRNSVSDCAIFNCTNGLIANASSNVSIAISYFNCSTENLHFNNCNFTNIYVISSTSAGNVAPDTPSLNGSSMGDPGKSYTYSSITNDSNDDQMLYMFDWGDGNTSDWLWLFTSNSTVNATHSYANEGGYFIRVKTKDVYNNESNWSEPILFKTENLTPLINSVNNSPDVYGFGFNVTITTNVTDDMSGNYSGIKYVKTNITYPDNTTGNFTMDYIGNNTYKYNFSGTWLVGQYNYSIWTIDKAYNSNISSVYSFNVSAQATLTIATLKDSYGINEYINITDPPPPSNDYNLVGRGLTWNKFYNATSDKNILEAYTSPINYQDESGNWKPIECNISLIDNIHPTYNYGYRAGNEHGIYHVYFKPNAQDRWPVVFAYNKSTDSETHVIRSKLVGIGYLDPSQNWTYKYLQSVRSSQGQINGHSATYEDVFNGTDVVWTYGNTGLKEEIIMSNITKTLLQNHPPSEYGLNNQHSYLVFITKLDYKNLDLYNSSGMLSGNFTTSERWIDFKDDIGQFKCTLPVGEAYELDNESVRQGLTYRILQYNDNYYLLSGLKVTDLNDMTFPVVIDPTLTVSSSSDDGDITGDGTPYSTVQGAPEGCPIYTATTLSIGQRCDSVGPVHPRHLPEEI
jgi:PKD repeat protein